APFRRSSRMKFSDTLTLLIANANLVPEAELQQAVTEAKRLEIPLERALIMSKRASEQQLQIVLKAQQLVVDGKISLETAVNAVRLCLQQNMSLDQAVRKLSEIHQRTVSVSSIGSQIGGLLLAAGVITQEQLGRNAQRSVDTKVPLGRLLRLNREISSQMLNSVINGQLLLRDKKVDREQLIEALKLSHKKKISVEQSLFELGVYSLPGESELRLVDLYSMAGLLAESDRLECLELEILKEKPLGQILLEQGLTSQEQLEAAIHLQVSSQGGLIKAYQAAEALKRVAIEKISVYQAIAEQRPHSRGPLRLGDLVIEAGLTTKDAVEQAMQNSQGGNIKIGRLLLSAGLLNETRLFNALRCQSLVRCGFISDVQAIAALRRCDTYGATLDDTFNQLGWYAPSSMQWLWV
ncbi:MAG: hypothetical protein ACRD3W_16900, partial [Terriglobales bacterium]